MHRPFAMPGVRPRYAPDRPFDIKHIRLELRLDFDGRAIFGTVFLRVAARTPGPRPPLVLDAVEMEILSVEAAGAPLEHEYDGARLRVHLPMAPELEVAVRYRATPRRGLYFIAPEPGYPEKPRQVWSQGQDEDARHWFPCADSPHQKATTELVVTVPDGMIAISNGRLVERRGQTFHFRLAVPHSPYLVMLAAGAFAEIRDRWEEVELSYFVPPGREEDARRALGRTPEMMAFFSRWLGVRYPYDRYSQVLVADFIFGGMENTTATTLTADTLHDARAHLDYSSEPLVSHELAHQWFGDLVTCRDWSEGWLHEGFATYLECLWREEAEGKDEFQQEIAGYADEYMREDQERYRRPLVTREWEEPLEIFDRHLYEKGACVLHMLRTLLGDDGLRAALRRFLEKHAGGVVESRDLARAIEEATGRNVDRFFDQWVYGAGFPELRARYDFDEDSGMVRLELEQTHAAPPGTAAAFALELDLAIEAAGAWRTLRISLEDRRRVFHLPVPARPTAFVLDPGRALLGRWQIEKPPALWQRQLAAAPGAIDRARAAAGVAKEATPAARAVLEAALTGDAFWGVRAQSAAALGSLRTDAARDALLRALANEPHPKARRAVARALGEWRGAGPAAEALAALVRRGDPSYFVEAEATLALCRTRAPEALEIARLALDRPSHQEIIRQLACQGLGELREPDERRAAALALLEAQTAWGRPPQSRRAAAEALGRLGEGRPEARETLCDLLRDADFRVRLQAVIALGVLGDARAIGPLETARERELDGRVKRRIQEVVRDLREGSSHAQGLRALSDEIDRLRAESARLASRLDALEARAKGPP